VEKGKEPAVVEKEKKSGEEIEAVSGRNRKQSWNLKKRKRAPKFPVRKRKKPNRLKQLKQRSRRKVPCLIYLIKNSSI